MFLDYVVGNEAVAVKDEQVEQLVLFGGQVDIGVVPADRLPGEDIAVGVGQFDLVVRDPFADRFHHPEFQLFEGEGEAEVLLGTPAEGESERLREPSWPRKMTGASIATHYSYGTRGELRSVVKPDGTTIEYVHNANNQRAAKKVNGAITEKYLMERPYDAAGGL